MTERFELLLFTTDEGVVERAAEAGVDGVIVDWERRGKRRRQADADTQINEDTPEDLRRVRAVYDGHLLCRIDGCGPHTAEQIEVALDCGADEILLPMVRDPREVVTALEAVRGRCGLGILIETVSAVLCARELASLPVTRAYLGLNDLAIERRTPNIFTALADGTAERVAGEVVAAGRGVPLGLGGLTLPDRGAPIPCRLLIGEMARLGCSFSFLRRSFLADTHGRDLSPAVASIRDAIAEARARGAVAALADRLALETAVAAEADGTAALADA